MDIDDTKFVEQHWTACNAMWENVQSEMNVLWVRGVNNVSFTADEKGPAILVMYDSSERPPVPETVKGFRVKTRYVNFNW